MIPRRALRLDVPAGGARPGGDPPDDDPVLVARIRAGELRAFEMLFDRYAAPLLVFARRQVGSLAVAEEIVQDVFFRVWAGRERWVLRRSVRAYLYQAVYHRALNHFRDTRDERRRVVSINDAPEATRHTADTRTDAPLNDDELRRAIDQAMATLPEKNRQVFHLVRRQQLSNAEAAEVLGITVKSVEAHMQRAVRALREALAAWDPKRV